MTPFYQLISKTSYLQHLQSEEQGMKKLQLMKAKLERQQKICYITKIMNFNCDDTHINKSSI